jgi:hypothetical protein
VATAPVVALAATYTPLTTLSSNQTFSAYQSTITYELKTGGGYQFFGNNARATSQVKWDQASQSYIVRDTGNLNITSSFGPSSFVSSDTAYKYYSKNGGKETFKLLTPGVANTFVPLTYTTYGMWRRTSTGTGFQGATQYNDTYLVWGSKTAGADVPRSGSANWAGRLDGSFVNKTTAYTLSGPASFSTTWSSGQISFSMIPTATPTVGAPVGFGGIAGSGPISFNNASFGASGNNGTYSVQMNGYFFGPAATEIGSVFKIAGNGGTGTGAIVGKQ